MNADFVNGRATFIMPHWRNDNDESRIHLEKAVEGILNQTDENWQLVIIDDKSPCREAIEYLDKIKELRPERIEIILRDFDDGPGQTRNDGIKWAYEHCSPIILYNDADDISHPKRLETVRKIFSEDPEAAVVYSTFKVIDQNDNPVEEKDLTQSILEILEGHKANPVQGKDAWIQIGTEKGYTNLTSSTSVKTEIAFRYPFPEDIVSEDQHTWFRYSAGGGKFVYSDAIPSLYRIPQGKPTLSRARVPGFYRMKAEADTKGFLEAIDISLVKGSIKPEDREELEIRFYIKLGETFGREHEDLLAEEQIKKAAAISIQKAREIILKKGLQNKVWAKEIVNV